MSVEPPSVESNAARGRSWAASGQQKPISLSPPLRRRVVFEVHAGPASGVLAVLVVAGVLACILLLLLGLLMVAAIVIAVVAIVVMVRARIARGPRHRAKR